MPPTRRSAAAAAAASAPAATAAAQVSQPLAGCAVALTGRFDDQGTSQALLEKLVVSLGGTVTKSITKTTTHLVCTLEEYDNKAVKVNAARQKGLPMVSASWVLESDTQKAQADADKHSFPLGTWQKLGGNGTAASPPTPPAAPAAAATKKRPIAIAKSDDDEPQVKKAKGGAKTATNGTKKANGKAAAKDEPEEEPKLTKEERKVAEGQFIKKKNAAIPLDEFCPLTNYQVYVDPDTGLIWDASLNQSNSANNNNKFYRLQVSCILFIPRGVTHAL